MPTIETRQVTYTIPDSGTALPSLGYTLPPGRYRGELTWTTYVMAGHPRRQLSKATIYLTPQIMMQLGSDSLGGEAAITQDYKAGLIREDR